MISEVIKQCQIGKLTKIEEKKLYSCLFIFTSFAHHLTIKRLSFRKKYDSDSSSTKLYLASCSDDSSVRLFTFSVSN